MSAGSRLSSLLVRDGLIGVKRMEQAFQRQVIYSGTLDTILLEMGLITEERLIEYLSMASGLPPADRALLEYFDPRAVQVCPRDLAEEYRVVPLAFEGEALRVLTIDPVDLGQLENLATRLTIPVQPFVTPEFRFATLSERIYGLPTPPRYLALAAKQATLQKPQTPEPKVLVEDPEVRRHVEIPGQRTRTGEMSTDAVRRAVESEERRRAASQSGVPVPQKDVPTPPRRVPTNPPVTVAPGEPGSSGQTPSSGVVRAPWRGGQTVDPQPLEPRAAADALTKAEDRDAIFSALVRGARARARYASLLIVQGDMVYGRVAIDGDQVDTSSVTQIALPYTQVPALRSAVETRAPFLGPVASSGTPTRLFGGPTPPTVAIVPVVIRDRVVALVVAHRAPEPMGVAEMADIVPLANEAASALSRLILRAKQQGYRKAEAVPAPAEADVSSKHAPGRDGWAIPRGGASDVEPPEVTVTEEPVADPRGVAELIDAIEKGDEPAASTALKAALARPQDVAPVLRRRFPGKLWIDRYAGAGRPMRAAQHGPLLALTVQLGVHVVPSLAELLSESERETRYYATRCCVEVRSPLLVLGLVGRLFDADHGVRQAALEALQGYPLRELDPALETVRSALHGDTGKARAAAHALGELRDVGAVSDLIAATERDHTTAEEARRALIAITKQDFGTKGKKWRTWWEKNRERPRIEWMLDGLAHAEDDVRLSASEELKRITGEYFGYHYDLPKREREEARLKWLKWWEETGRRRFMRDGVRELDRSTAVLPNARR